MKTAKFIPDNAIHTIKQKAFKNKKLRSYLKENNFTFKDVNILELTSKGWRVLQKGISQIEILIIDGKINLLLPL